MPDPAELIDALLAEAVQAARRRAEGMATAAGRRLGRVLSVSDRRAESDDEFDQELRIGTRMSGPSDSDDGVPPVIPRPQRLSVAVAVVFELVD